MRLRDLIEQLQEIARTSGDFLDVDVPIRVGCECAGGSFEENHDVVAAEYRGGRSVQLITD